MVNEPVIQWVRPIDIEPRGPLVPGTLVTPVGRGEPVGLIVAVDDLTGDLIDTVCVLWSSEPVVNLWKDMSRRCAQEIANEIDREIMADLLAAERE